MTSFYLMSGSFFQFVNSQGRVQNHYVNAPNLKSAPPQLFKFRYAVYAIVLILFLILIRRVHNVTVNGSSDSAADAIGEMIGQFGLPVILTVAGGVTYWARRRGLPQGLAFAIPVLVDILITFTIIPKGFGRLLLAMTIIPMIVICGIIALVVKPRPLQISSESDPNLTPKARVATTAPRPNDVPTNPEFPQIANSKPQTSIFTGLFMLLLGSAGLAWFPYQIVNHRSSYGLLGYEEYTIQDNLRMIGPLALLSLHLFIMGIGVICRWRWAKRPALLIGFAIVFVLWFALNK